MRHLPSNPRALSGLVAACALLSGAAPAVAAAGTPAGVDLQGRVVNPAAEQSADRAQGQDVADPGAQLVVVRFRGAPQDAWRAALAATGVRIVTYLAEDAYLVRADPGQAAALDAYTSTAPEVASAFVLDAADKLPPRFPVRGRVHVAVQTLTGADGASARTAAVDAGTPTQPALGAGPYRTLRLDLPAGAARALAADPGVVAIEADGAPRELDERQGLIMESGALAAGPGAGYLAAHDALLYGPEETPETLPFVVDIADSAFADGTDDPADADFHVDGDGDLADRVAYVHKATDDASDPVADQGCDGHGTLNASILAGHGDVEADAAGFRYGLGIEPRARIGGTTIFTCGGDYDTNGRSLSSLVADGYLASGPGYDGARVGSNSWGDTGARGAYTATAQTYDALVRDAVPAQPGAQEIVEVFAAGNDGPDAGSLAAPGTAKNVISVGASENVHPFGTDACSTTDGEADDPEDLAVFSSRGPTADGRRKPDLVAPGTHVAGRSWRETGSGSDGRGVCGVTVNGGTFPGALRYTASSGTSHSAPAVAGLAAAARAAFRRAVGTWPSAAMVKAMLIDGTQALTGDGAGSAPNDVQGYGLARLAGATTAGRWFSDQDLQFSDSGQAAERVVGVTDPGRSLQATLVWTDAPGPLLGAAYVNDLDLEIVADGQVYRGNHLADGVSTPGGAPDERNNVERIVLPAGLTGELEVRVRATTIAGDGVPGDVDPTDQDLALILTNADVPTSESWTRTPTPVTPPPPTTTPPTTTPTTTQPAAQPPPGTGTTPKPTTGRLRVTGPPSSRRCFAGRAIALRAHQPATGHLRRVTVRISGRVRAHAAGNHAVRTFRLRSLPRTRAFRVAATATTTDGRTLTWVRTFRPCTRAAR